MPILILLIATAAVGAFATFLAGRLVAIVGAGTAAGPTAPPGWLRRRLDPARASGLALTVALATAIAGGLVVGALADVVHGGAAPGAIDSGAAVWADDHASAVSTRLLYLVTDLGEWPALLLVGLAVLLLDRRRAPSRHATSFVLAVVLGDQVLTIALKALTDRHRPTLNPVAATLGPSFPSGHSSTAAATYAALALVLARRRAPRLRALLVGVAVALGVAVASSRVLLVVHWLSDTIAGLALGWAWLALCAIAFGPRLLAFGASGAPPASPDAEETSRGFAG